MTRVLSIAVALVAFCAVVSASAAAAVPLHAASAVSVHVDDACVEPGAHATKLVGSFCVKRHTLGLPCAPLPVVLPGVAALPEAVPDAVAHPAEALGRLEPAWRRLFRPPRGTGA